MTWRSEVPRRRCAQGRDNGPLSRMSRFLVSLLRHTLTSEDVTAFEALMAEFGNDARDVSACCESGKTVLDAIKYSEKTGEGVDRLVAVLVLLTHLHLASC